MRLKEEYGDQHDQSAYKKDTERNHKEPYKGFVLSFTHPM